MKWQPIETAPKDGTLVLVCSIKVIGRRGTYVPESGFYGHFHPNSKGKEVWRNGSGVKIYPDFWMPLPDPPQ